MSTENGYLALLLDGPLQSWGFSSRFQRRTTALHPSKSGVIGLISAAMGLAKDSVEGPGALPDLAKLKMTSIAIPRDKPEGSGPLPVRRMEDFHTTGGGYDKKAQSQFIPRKASGGPCDNPTVSHRQYLLDARFGVILEGSRSVLERAAAALEDPVWGVWLGRKSCIPSAPVLVGLCESPDSAWKAVLRACKLSEEAPMGAFTTVSEVSDFAHGTDSISDQPVSFGDGTSSGPDKRQFAVRRIKVIPGRPIETPKSTT